MFTLSGAHVFPMYDGAVNADPPMRILDVRHEQTAVFAAEAVGKLTRVPGPRRAHRRARASPTASAPITQAQFSGSPLRRRRRPGAGEPLGHGQPAGARPPAAARAGHQARARTVHQVGEIAGAVDEAFTAGRLLAPRADLPRRADGPVLRPGRRSSRPASAPRQRLEPDPDALAEVGALLAEAQRPVLVLGTDVWADGAEEAALRFVEADRHPGRHQRHGPRRRPRRPPAAGHQGPRQGASAPPTWSSSSGTPLDFRLGYGVFGGKDGAPAGPGRAPRRLPRPGLRARRPRRLGVRRPDRRSSTACRRRWSRSRASPTGPTLGRRPAGRGRGRASSATPRCCAREADPIHPARIYGELVPRLADDAVVIGDGGDFVSFAGKYVEPKRPGGWLDPGPYGCLGAGLGSAIAARIARPSAQVVLLLGDGAAGMSLMDVDTLVRHDLPVVMVCGNNSAWGLEKQPDADALRLRRRGRPGPADPLRRGRHGARRRRRDGHRPGPDRPGPGPGVRGRHAVPGQRDHRRRTRPTRAPPSASDDVDGPSGPRTPTSSPRSGELTVAAYAADGLLVEDDPYADHLRDAATRAREAELYVAERRRPELAGTVTFCPQGSPWSEVAEPGEGEFRMLAVAPAPGGAASREALVGVCLERSRELGYTGGGALQPRGAGRRAPHLRAARVPPAPRPGLVAPPGLDLLAFRLAL